ARRSEEYEVCLLELPVGPILPLGVKIRDRRRHFSEEARRPAAPIETAPQHTHARAVARFPPAPAELIGREVAQLAGETPRDQREPAGRRGRLGALQLARHPVEALPGEA